MYRNKIVFAFFQLVQIGMHEKGRFDGFLSEEEWRQVYRLATEQTVLGICFVALKFLESSQLPSKQLLLLWFGEVERIRTRNKRVNDVANEVCRRLVSTGCRYSILKGQGIASLYSSPMLRQSGDIDIILDEKKESVLNFLYQNRQIKDVLYHHTRIYEKGILIEIHFTPSWMFSYFTNKRLQSFFLQEKEHIFGHTIRWENTEELNVPTVAFNRVYILIHIYRHLFGEGVGLRQLMDYYYVLKQGFTEEERLDTVTILKKLKMEKFARGVMYVLQKVFALESSFFILPPDRLHGEFLLSEVLQAGNFGHYDQRKQTNMNDSSGVLFFKRCRRNLRFLRYYPSETLWTPLFKIWHFCWRKYHSWI